MHADSKPKKTLLWIIATGVVCIGIGFAAGAAMAALKIGQSSHINEIQSNLFTLKSIENSPQEFKSVLSISTRTRIATAVCYQYANASDDNKSKIRKYIDEYNALVRNSNNHLSLPPISKTSDNGEIRSAYCAIRA